MQYKPMQSFNLAEVPFNWPQFWRPNNKRTFPMCLKTAHIQQIKGLNVGAN